MLFTLTTAWFGLDREGRISRISLSTRTVSPGLVGLGHAREFFRCFAFLRNYSSHQLQCFGPISKLIREILAACIKALPISGTFSGVTRNAGPETLKAANSFPESPRRAGTAQTRLSAHRYRRSEVGLLLRLSGQGASPEVTAESERGLCSHVGKLSSGCASLCALCLDCAASKPLISHGGAYRRVSCRLARARFS